MTSPIRTAKTNESISGAERFALLASQTSDPPAAAAFFLDLCLECTATDSGAVFLAEPTTGEIAACPASRGGAVSSISRRQLEKILQAGKPRRVSSREGSARLLALPLREGNRRLGLLLLSGAIRKGSKPELLHLASLFARKISGPDPSGAPLSSEDSTRRLVHDFRNLVAGISGYAQILHQHAEQLDRKQIQEYSLIIEREANRIGRLAEDHLRNLRGEESEQRSVRRLPAEIVGEVHALMAADLEKSGIHLLSRIETEKPIEADPDLLLRALVNLLVNAKQALPSGGIIEIAAEQSAEGVEFRVSDSGSGIPKDLAKKIFLVPATHGKKNGNGLGLRIVKEAADLFGGSVRIEASPFGGTTVVLHLPS